MFTQSQTRMKNLHVLMADNSDINALKMLINYLPFTKGDYETILVECVPTTMKNENALKFVAKNLANQGFDFQPDLKKKLGLSDIEFLVLKNVYPSNQTPLTDEKKIQLKFTIINNLTERGLRFNSLISAAFSQFYYYHYLSVALKNGIELIGIEDPSYIAGCGKFSKTRNQILVNNTLEAMKEKQNCLMIIGASHGFDLIAANKKSGMIKYLYTHLKCSKINSENDNIHDDPANYIKEFRNKITSGNYSLTEYESYVYLDFFKKGIDPFQIFGKRILDSKSNELFYFYHEYGRNPADQKSTFCSTLSQLSDLPFSMSLDKEYYADAVCIINDKEKMQAAKAIKAKTGIGTFFKSDKGNDVFVVKNTNAPENLQPLAKALDTLSKIN